MADATVFVDDAVRGRLPKVCVKSGEPATRSMRITQDLSGSYGALWILVFFGPLGWLLFAVLVASRRRQELTVRLPYSAEVLDWYQAARRQMFWCVGVVAALIGAGIVAPFALPIVSDQLAVAGVLTALVGGAIAVAICSYRARRLLVVLSLDASGRWVTLHKVHPAFVEACRAAEERRPVAERSGW